MFTIISYNRSTSTGKSEGLKQLAAACCRKNPDKRYLVIDADPQATLLNWYNTAPDAPKPFDVVAYGEHEGVISSYNGVFYDSEGKPPEEVQNAILGAAKALIFIPTPVSKWKLYDLSVKSAVDCLKNGQNFIMAFTLVSDSQNLDPYRKYTKAWVDEHLLDTHIPTIEALEEVHNIGSLPQYMAKGHASRAIIEIFDNIWLEVEKNISAIKERENKYAIQNAA